MRGNLSLLDKTVEVFKLNIFLVQRSSSRSGHLKKTTKYPTKFWTENFLVVVYLSGNPWKIPSLMARLIQKKYFDGIEKKGWNVNTFGAQWNKNEWNEKLNVLIGGKWL